MRRSAERARRSRRESRRGRGRPADCAKIPTRPGASNRAAGGSAEAGGGPTDSRVSRRSRARLRSWPGAGRRGRRRRRASGRPCVLLARPRSPVAPVQPVVFFVCLNPDWSRPPYLASRPPHDLHEHAPIQARLSPRRTRPRHRVQFGRTERRAAADGGAAARRVRAAARGPGPRPREQRRRAGAVRNHRGSLYYRQWRIRNTQN